MSQENVEIVRSIYAAWERGDYSSVDSQHPEIEFAIADGPSPGRWTGATGIKQGWGAFLSAWEGFHHQADEYRQIDGERVLVLTRFGGRGKTSGMDIGQMGTKGAMVFHVRGDKVTRSVLYFDRNRAFADLDLSE
jgi:ketosteroid isomerase-like protein